MNIFAVSLDNFCASLVHAMLSRRECHIHMYVYILMKYIDICIYDIHIYNVIYICIVPRNGWHTYMYVIYRYSRYTYIYI